MLKDIGLYLSRINAVLILGCKGFEDEDGFVYCHGVGNVILDLESLGLEKYNKIDIFLEKACGLFRSPVEDYNKCSNILNMLYKTFEVISLEMLEKIQYYLNSHRKCNPYLLLILKEDYNGKK